MYQGNDQREFWLEQNKVETAKSTEIVFQIIKQLRHLKDIIFN